MSIDQSKYAKKLFLFFLIFSVLLLIESIPVFLHGTVKDVVFFVSILIFTVVETLQQYLLFKARPISKLKVGLDLAQILVLVLAAANRAANHRELETVLFLFGVVGFMLRLHYDVKALKAKK